MVSLSPPQMLRSRTLLLSVGVRGGFPATESLASRPPRRISWASFLLREVEFCFFLVALTGRLHWASLRTSKGIFFFQGLFLLICSHAKIFALLKEGTYFFFPQCLFSWCIYRQQSYPLLEFVLLDCTSHIPFIFSCTICSPASTLSY